MLPQLLQIGQLCGKEEAGQQGRQGKQGNIGGFAQKGGGCRKRLVVELAAKPCAGAEEVPHTLLQRRADAVGKAGGDPQQALLQPVQRLGQRACHRGEAAEKVFQFPKQNAAQKPDEKEKHDVNEAHTDGGRYGAGAVKTGLQTGCGFVRRGGGQKADGEGQQHRTEETQKHPYACRSDGHAQKYLPAILFAHVHSFF